MKKGNISGIFSLAAVLFLLLSANCSGYNGSEQVTQNFIDTTAFLETPVITPTTTSLHQTATLESGLSTNTPSPSSTITPSPTANPLQHLLPEECGENKEIEIDQNADKSGSQDGADSRYDYKILENVRKGLRSFGKEAATHRFTLMEKEAITDLIYNFSKLGIRTNENEITRIAVNFILEDFKENENTSILTRIIAMVNE